MPTVISCPSCQRKLQVPEALAGENVQCPTCSATFVAQSEGANVPAAKPDAVPPPEMTAPVDRSPRRAWGDDDDDYEPEPYRPRRRRNDLEPHRGTMILVLGILSLVLGAIGFIMGPIAWIMGNNDLRAIREGRMDPEGEGLTNAGRICGMISTILLVVFLAFACLWIGIMVLAIGARPGQRF